LVNSYRKGKSIEKIAGDNSFDIALAYGVVLYETYVIQNNNKIKRCVGY
jgi:hypothetical protein